MKNGFLIFVGWDSTPQRIQVRACPDPGAARAMLEGLIQRPVRWETAR